MPRSRGVREENARLARREHRPARAAAAGPGQRGRRRRLRTLLGCARTCSWTTTGAEVVAGSLSPDYRAITIDKGLGDGDRARHARAQLAGVLGRVALPAGNTATVQLIIDRSAAVAVRIERTRTEGIALGHGDGTLRLEYLSATAEITEGDTVVTAGIDGDLPARAGVGRVERVERAGPAYRQVVVRPFADFSRLETVLVLVAPAPVWAPPLVGAGTEGGAMTALRVAALVLAAVLLQGALSRSGGGAPGRPRPRGGRGRAGCCTAAWRAC